MEQEEKGTTHLALAANLQFRLQFVSNKGCRFSGSKSCFPTAGKVKWVSPEARLTVVT